MSELSCIFCPTSNCMKKSASEQVHDICNWLLFVVFTKSNKGLFVCYWHDSPQWARSSSFTRFLDQTQWCITVVGLLWKSDQLVTETSTWQQTPTADRHPCPGGIRTHNLSWRAVADLRLRLRGHWDRPIKGSSKSRFPSYFIVSILERDLKELSLYTFFQNHIHAS
jgi:hypothetical protein